MSSNSLLSLFLTIENTQYTLPNTTCFIKHVLLSYTQKFSFLTITHLDDSVLAFTSSLYHLYKFLQAAGMVILVSMEAPFVRSFFCRRWRRRQHAHNDMGFFRMPCTASANAMLACLAMLLKNASSSFLFVWPTLPVISRLISAVYFLVPPETGLVINYVYFHILQDHLQYHMIH